jgi:hypothetical protein
VPFVWPSESAEVSNGDFEVGMLAPWVPFQEPEAAVETDPRHVQQGRFSLSEAGAGSVYQDVSGLLPGHTYRVTAWVTASAGTTATAYIALWDPSGSQQATNSPAVVPQTDWRPVSTAITIGSAGIVRIHLFRSAGTGILYWDNVRIHLE